MTEEWRDVAGWEGLYLVSNLGKVMSLRRVDRYGRTLGGNLLKPVDIGNGYYRVRLSHSKRREYISVHRMVATAFVPNPHNYTIINHKDENPANNEAENLEWCTQKYNINYGNRNKKAGAKHRGDKCYFTKLKESDVLEIREIAKGKHGKELCQNLAQKYGVSPSNIRHIIVRDSWNWI